MNQGHKLPSQERLHDLSPLTYIPRPKCSHPEQPNPSCKGCIVSSPLPNAKYSIWIEARRLLWFGHSGHSGMVRLTQALHTDGQGPACRADFPGTVTLRGGAQSYCSCSRPRHPQLHLVLQRHCHQPQVHHFMSWLVLEQASLQSTTDPD